MKLFIASDIHGSSYWCEKMLDAFKKSGADKLVILGDILYHGPRNDLPRDYAPKKVIAMLNLQKDKILCVRGNCEAEVDQMVLDFPVLADYACIFADNLSIYLTHGHLWSEEKPLPLEQGSVLLCGHTHVSKCTEHEGFIYMNPGSVSIPKDNTPNGYMIYENRRFDWYSLSDNMPFMTKEI